MSDENRTMTDDSQLKIPEVLPVLPLRDIVVFPFMIVPLFVSRDRSIRAVDQSLSENRLIFLTAQKDMNQEEPTTSELYTTGTVSIIMRMLKLPDGRIRILAQGLTRARVEYFDENTRPYLQAKITVINEQGVENPGVELTALIRNVRGALEKAVSLGKNVSSEVMVLMANLDDPGRLADLVASNLELKPEEAQIALELVDSPSRLRKIHDFLTKELELLTVQQEINIQAKGEIDKSQREFYLRQQLKAIQQELGEGNELSEEAQQLREKIAKASMPKEVNEECERQLKRLERMHPDSAETAIIRNYLEWMSSLPWSISSTDNLDLHRAQAVLDEDHHGLEKIKERIVEYLAVRKLKADSKGPILCFVGPPGVGKTSLGKSIARALDRKFVRLSLGGVHDEAEIRGHRRTYVGAMPGRIIQGIHQTGSNNPVFMMDEVDKIGMDYRGDPSSALLEVLDPEQNFSFRDNYLGVPFDLSKVLFITTANMLDPIQPAFRDRMEVIELTGYTEEEKLAISKKHLIPKQFAEHGLKSKQLQITDRALRMVISQYTREAGLRNLEREIGGICRKVARKIAEGQTEKCLVTPDNMTEFLGVPRILPEELLKKDQVGVATGLAWTPAGGDIMYIEATAMKGKGGLTLTGKLGEVMKESAQAALSYARSKARELGVDDDYFQEHDIHVHVPEGAIPKDGPSAGITMATAMISLFTGQPVKKNVAMTGEITLRGNVLPIGGLKEKVLAARRAKIKTVIIPALNHKDLQDLPKNLVKVMKFVPVEEVREVLNVALIKESQSHSGARSSHARKNPPKK
jgi:ATP-dependent Lon protease